MSSTQPAKLMAASIEPVSHNFPQVFLLFTFLMIRICIYLGRLHRTKDAPVGFYNGGWRGSAEVDWTPCLSSTSSR